MKVKISEAVSNQEGNREAQQKVFGSIVYKKYHEFRAKQKRVLITKNGLFQKLLTDNSKKL